MHRELAHRDIINIKDQKAFHLVREVAIRLKYNELSNLIKHMRLDEWLPWEVLEDRVRRVSGKRGWEDHNEFMEAHIDDFLEGYERCYVQDQKCQVEIWTEKDVRFQVVERVAYPYCIRSVTCVDYRVLPF